MPRLLNPHHSRSPQAKGDSMYRWLLGSSVLLLRPGAQGGVSDPHHSLRILGKSEASGANKAHDLEGTGACMEVLGASSSASVGGSPSGFFPLILKGACLARVAGGLCSLPGWGLTVEGLRPAGC